MSGDQAAVVKVTAWAIASMAYARFASSSTNPGMLRLLSLLPIVVLLNHLPSYFASINLRTAVSFYLPWLAVFKLLLLAFGTGPLSTIIAVTSLPLKIRAPNKHSSVRSSRFGLLSCVKLVLLVALSYVYQCYPWLLPVVCCLYLYLFLELILGCANLLAASLLGLSLEPYVHLAAGLLEAQMKSLDHRHPAAVCLLSCQVSLRHVRCFHGSVLLLRPHARGRLLSHYVPASHRRGHSLLH